ncbi:MAG: oligosaccharide flippase family protein [Nitrosomonas sp.]|nr:oligosaccharide flippase family protein [Nitrosomonas sp.]
MPVLNKHPGQYSGIRFRQAIKHFLLGRAAQAISSFILLIWLVRLLTPADYGAYMVLWGMVDMMVMISSFGMLDAVRRFLPELVERGAPGVLAGFVRWMTLIRLVIMVIWAALIVIFWSDIAGWMGFSVSQQDTALLAAGLIITVISFRYAAEMLECLLEQRWSQLTRALLPLGRLVGVAMLVTVGSLTLAQLLWVDLIVSLVCFLLAEFFLMRKLRRLPGVGDYRVGVREIASFAWHMTGVNLLHSAANAGTLRILVARTLGLEAAGMFAFLQQLLTMVGRYLPANLLASIIRPMLISRYVAGETGIVNQGMALLWKINILIISAGMAMMVVAGDAFIMLASSGRFADAGLIMLIMLMGLGATSQSQLVVMIMQIYPYARKLKYFGLLSILTPLTVIGGSEWGLLGVASGIVLSVWLFNGLTLRWLNRQTSRIELDWSGALRGLGLVMLLAVSGWVIGREFGSWWALTFVLLAYMPGLVLVKPLNPFDMALLNRGLQQRARFFALFVRTN